MPDMIVKKDGVDYPVGVIPQSLYNDVNGIITNSYPHRETSTLGSKPTITVNCGFRARKITCYAHCGDNIRRSSGVSSASGNYILDYTDVSKNNGSMQGDTGVLAHLKYDDNNYRTVSISTITDTSITFSVTGTGYGGDSTSAIYDFYIE